MSVDRAIIPSKARNRQCIPWRLSIGKELTSDELQAVAAVFLHKTEYHSLIQANVYPGITQIEGDYFGTRGRNKDLSQVARRWDEVQERFPELIVDAIVEYRVPGALLDNVEALAVDDLTDPNNNK